MDLSKYRNIILCFLVLIYVYYNNIINKKYFYVFLLYFILICYIEFTILDFYVSLLYYV